MPKCRSWINDHRRVAILSDQELKKKETKHLIRILRSVTAVISSIYFYAGPRCCEICHEFLGDKEEWEEYVVIPSKPLEEYRNRIKEILSTREHIDRKVKGRKQRKSKRQDRKDKRLARFVKRK